MTAMPEPLVRLLTIDEYAALGETEQGYTELVEGRIVVSPSPAPNHNKASMNLAIQLTPTLPDDLEVILDIDVDLQFAAPDRPGFSRRPDLIVVKRSAVRRVGSEGGLLRASDVVVVVEVVSPGSCRTDHVTKRGEYADAGIPHYWIIDLDEPVSMLTCHAAGEFGYRDSGSMTGVVEISEPFPAQVDLDRLR